MSPRTSTLLALIGVLLAGIPLPRLTAARREAPAVEQQAAPAPHMAYATLRWSGRPLKLHLLHEGRELALLGEDELSLPTCELELPLPATGNLALEITARWAETGQPQAISLTLEPDGLPTQTDTHWTAPDGNNLHSLFLFSW